MAVPLYCHRQHGNESVSSSRRIPLLEGGCALGLQQPSEPWDGTPSLQDPPGSYIQYWETLQMLLNTASDVCAVRWGSAAATSMWTISFVLKMHTYIYIDISCISNITFSTVHLEKSLFCSSVLLLWLEVSSSTSRIHCWGRKVEVFFYSMSGAFTL